MMCLGVFRIIKYYCLVSLQFPVSSFHDNELCPLLYF